MRRSALKVKFKCQGQSKLDFTRQFTLTLTLNLNLRANQRIFMGTLGVTIYTTTVIEPIYSWFLISSFTVVCFVNII